MTCCPLSASVCLCSWLGLEVPHADGAAETEPVPVPVPSCPAQSGGRLSLLSPPSELPRGGPVVIQGGTFIQWESSLCLLCVALKALHTS